MWMRLHLMILEELLSVIYLDAGADIVTVAKLAGHRTPSTTSKYIGVGKRPRNGRLIC